MGAKNVGKHPYTTTLGGQPRPGSHTADRGWEKAVSPASPTKNRASDRKYFRGVMNPLDEVFCIAKHTNEHSPGIMHRVTNNDEHASIAISNHVMTKGIVPSCTPPRSGYQLGGGREKLRGGRNLRLKHTSLSSTQANHVM
jgi:hypothetical protein